MTGIIRLMAFVPRGADRRRMAPTAKIIFPYVDLVPLDYIDRERAAEAIICSAVEAGVIPYRKRYERRL